MLLLSRSPNLRTLEPSNFQTMLPEQHAIRESNFQLPGQTAFYRGKVRDVYTLGEQLLMVASDRISAFDYVLPRPIPYKGQVLNQIAAHFLKATADIVPNWLLATPIIKIKNRSKERNRSQCTDSTMSRRQGRQVLWCILVPALCKSKSHVR